MFPCKPISFKVLLKHSITRTHFGSPFEFEPPKFYCIFLDYNVLFNTDNRSINLFVTDKTKSHSNVICMQT